MKSFQARSSAVIGRRPARLAMPLVLASLMACDIGQTCEDEPPTPAGDLDRIGDAVLVKTPSPDGQERSWVVMSNPEIEQLRVYDVLERQFVRAPNVFFPLSLRTGPSTRRLATPVGDDSLVLALDGSTDMLLVVNMDELVELREGEFSPGFRVVLEAETGRAPGAVAALRTDDELLAFVTLPDEGALQVLQLDVDGGVSTELALVDLGEGAHPADVAVDPTGDAIVVTDARLSSVAIVRIADLTLDRRVEVGGPTGPVSIGRVDPGDGLAPVALVARRDAPELAALRLRRPLFREEPYALLARLEIPDFAATVHVNDASRPAPQACCEDSTNPAIDPPPDSATFAWGSFVAANGFLRYVRFDGARGPTWNGSRAVPRPPSARGVMRFLSYFEPAPAVSSVSWEPAAEGDPQPQVRVDSIDNAGEPPITPLLDSDLSLSLTYEGTPPGANNRRATLAMDGARWKVTVIRDSRDFSNRDVRDGDVIRVDTSGVGPTCPDSVSQIISDLGGDQFYLDDITDQHANCVSQGGEFRFTLFAKGDFVVSLSSHGYQGRLLRSDVGQSIEVPGWAMTVTANEAPSRGSRVVLGLSQGIIPIVVDLARPPDFQVDGFGTLGLLATAMLGDAVEVRDLDTGDVVSTTRMFIVTGAGALLEMEEGELLVERIRLHR